MPIVILDSRTPSRRQGGGSQRALERVIFSTSSGQGQRAYNWVCVAKISEGSRILCIVVSVEDYMRNSGTRSIFSSINGALCCHLGLPSVPHGCPVWALPLLSWQDVTFPDPSSALAMLFSQIRGGPIRFPR